MSGDPLARFARRHLQELSEARRLVGRDLGLDPVAWERAMELAAASRPG